MSVITISADSATLILNDRAMSNLAEGDYLTLTPANAASAHVNSASGGVSISERLDKDVYDLMFRVQKYSGDDVFMLDLLNSEGPSVVAGALKESYTIDGSAGVESWTLEAGSITTQPTSTKNNQDGNALMEYTLRFRTAKRSL
jgi:hypothetical protein